MAKLIEGRGKRDRGAATQDEQMGGDRYRQIDLRCLR